MSDKKRASMENEDSTLHEQPTEDAPAPKPNRPEQTDENQKPEQTLNQHTLVQTESSQARAKKLSLSNQEVPADVPGFRILHCLGEGAFGSVWQAVEQNTGKHVAIKFYSHRRALDWSLFNREVEKLAALYTSRRIISLIGVGWDHDPPYYVMEYLQNGSLANHLAEGPLSINESVSIITDVVHGLLHAHGSGILHCDLKPANILLDTDDEPRLCDFGQSRLSDEQLPALGTLFYMAPEQADLKAIPDARWDVYATGALLYHMLCGKPPYHSPEAIRSINSADNLEGRLEKYRKCLRKAPIPQEHRKVSGIDSKLIEIIDQCLDLTPKRRFANIQAVLDALQARERWKARRPFIIMGVLAPLLFLSAMWPIATNALQEAVGSAQETLINRAIESDLLTARVLANSLEDELNVRQNELVRIANDPELVNSLAKSQSNQWKPIEEEGKSFADLLKSNRAQVSSSVNDTSWFLTDEKGNRLWRDPATTNELSNYAYRDYFHGRGADLDQTSTDYNPDAIKPITAPHISCEFISTVTGKYMVAISVPIKKQNGEVLGVLARTSEIGTLLRNYEKHLESEEGEIDRKITLFETNSGLVLDHPILSDPQAPAELKEEKFNVSKKTIEKFKKLQTVTTEKRTEIERDLFYQDPFREVAPEQYAGNWLAAFAPVHNANWIAVVQEPRQAALQPVEKMRNGLLSRGITALIVAGTLIGTFWYFLRRIVKDRRDLKKRKRRQDAAHQGPLSTTRSE